MHPAVGILTLILLAATLPGLPLTWLAVAAIVLCAALRWPHGRECWNRFVVAAGRLRWLWFAIVVLYVGMTRDVPVHEALPGIGRAGVIEGTRRALVLLVLLAAVHHLMAVVPTARLAAGVCGLLQPFKPVGLDPDRVALRLALTLEQARSFSFEPAPGTPILDRAAQALLGVERDAARPPGTAAPLPALGPVPAWQWCLPLLPLLLSWAAT